MKLQAFCGECGELVDEDTVSDHMDAHGLLTAGDWSFTTWPDGTSVLVDPETGGPA